MIPGLDTLVAEIQESADRRLAEADARLAALYPGDPTSWQPVHTVYVPADRVDARTPRRWGESALELMDAYLGDPGVVARVTGMDEALAAQVLPRVRETLAGRPVEDLRVDFEDGYGRRPDATEDDDLAAAVEAMRVWGDTRGVADGAPRSYGMRIKCLEPAYRDRGLRTLVVGVAGVADGGELPEGFVVTLPKATSTDQVAAMVAACVRIEEGLGLVERSLRFEIQVETPQAILGSDGSAVVARLVHAAKGRCTGLHYGTFDYSAGLGIAAVHQSAEHPAADHAKATMQVAAAQTGVRVSDGSTNVVAFGAREDAEATWALHHRLVTRALERGFYQGWDMHPGHLPTRYLATYAFFRASLPASARRLRGYLENSGGEVMDEPATARMLAQGVLRGLRCGAVDEGEVQEAAGLDVAGLMALVG